MRLSEFFIKPSQGYTIIELIVVVAISAVIFAIGIASYNNFNQKRNVEKYTEELKSNLRLAQSKANNNETYTSCSKPITGWEIKYENSSSYSLCVICPVEDCLKTFSLNQTTISDFSATPILFKSLGGTQISSTIIIRITDQDDTSIFKEITIDKSGAIK